MPVMQLEYIIDSYNVLRIECTRTRFFIRFYVYRLLDVVLDRYELFSKNVIIAILLSFIR